MSVSKSLNFPCKSCLSLYKPLLVVRRLGILVVSRSSCYKTNVWEEKKFHRPVSEVEISSCERVIACERVIVFSAESSVTGLILVLGQAIFHCSSSAISRPEITCYCNVHRALALLLHFLHLSRYQVIVCILPSYKHIRHLLNY